MILFVAFTILIAIIANSYEDVRQLSPENGVVVSATQWAYAWCRAEEGNKEEDEPKDEPVGSYDNDKLRSELKEMKGSIAELTRVVALLLEQRNDIDASPLSSKHDSNAPTMHAVDVELEL